MISRYSVLSEIQLSTTARLLRFVGLILCFVFKRRLYKSKNLKPTQSIVLIEAGVKGWESVFFSEFFRSAQFTFGETMVHKSRINNSQKYLKESFRNLRLISPTHFIWDPRTCSQNRFMLVFQTTIIRIAVSILGIVPIVLLTDSSTRIWRNASNIMVGNDGVIISFIEMKSISRLLPSSQVLSPIFIPYLPRGKTEMVSEFFPGNRIMFLGSLYPIRREFFERINVELDAIKSRVRIDLQDKSSSIDVDEYWKRMKVGVSVITTIIQQPSERYKMDYIEAPQMVFRISEVLSSGGLLFTQHFEEMESYYQNDIEYIGFDSPKDAANKIDFASRNPNWCKSVSDAGYQRHKELVDKHLFWKSINSRLELVNRFTLPISSDEGIHDEYLF